MAQFTLNNLNNADVKLVRLDRFKGKTAMAYFILIERMWTFY